MASLTLRLYPKSIGNSVRKPVPQFDEDRGRELISGSASPTATADTSAFKVVAESAALSRTIVRAQEGDTRAMQFLYIRFIPDVRRYVRSLIKDQHEAEDITQTVFMKMIASIKKYEARDVPFVAWLLRIARNTTLSHFRSQRSIPVEEVIAQGDDGRLRREYGRAIRSAIDALPESQRQVIVLRHLVGMSLDEIAGVLGKTESSIHSLHHRGRINMQGALTEAGATPVVSGLEAGA
jgi:RNA polymerase sigma-70 factor, ECF subfamily